MCRGLEPRSPIINNSSMATFLPPLPMGSTFHSLYDMLELVANTRTLFTVPSFWQTSCWNRVMLSSDWDHRSRNSMVATMNLLTNMVWPSQTWEMTCFLCHSFPSSFNTGHDIIWATRWVFHEKQRTLTLPVHLVHAPSFWWSLGRSFLFSFFYVYFLLFASMLHVVSVLFPDFVSRPLTFGFG